MESVFFCFVHPKKNPTHRIRQQKKNAYIAIQILTPAQMNPDGNPRIRGCHHELSYPRKRLTFQIIPILEEKRQE